MTGDFRVRLTVATRCHWQWVHWYGAISEQHRSDFGLQCQGSSGQQAYLRHVLPAQRHELNDVQTSTLETRTKPLTILKVARILYRSNVE